MREPDCLVLLVVGLVLCCQTNCDLTGEEDLQRQAQEKEKGCHFERKLND